MRILIAIILLVSISIGDDWTDRRTDVGAAFKLVSEMKHNCLVEQDESKWKAQIIELRSFGFNEPTPDITINSMIGVLVNNAESTLKYYRADSIARLQSKDPEQIQYVIDYHKARIYSDGSLESKGSPFNNKQSVIDHLTKLVAALGG